MPHVTIVIPAGLRDLCQGLDEVDVVAGTVAEALLQLVGRCPVLQPRLFLPEGGLRPRVNLFVGAEPVHALAGLATPLGEDDRLLIVPAVAGG